MEKKGLSTKANMIWNSVGSMIYLGCQWLVTIVVVRLSSGYDDAGLLSLAMAVVGIFSTFANYKMGIYQVSDVNHENTVGEYMAFRFLTLTIAFVACLAYAFLTCPLYAVMTVILFYLFKSIGLIIDILHGVDQLNRRMDYIGISFMLQGVSTLLAFCLVFWLTSNINLSIVAMMFAALVVLVLFDIPKSSRLEPLRIKLSVSKALFFLKTSLPAVAASLAASAIFTVPKQYLCVVSGDAALGIYSSVAAPALIIQMGAMYLYGPLLDIFAKHFFKGSVDDFRRLLIKTVVGIMLVSVICIAILSLIGPWMLGLLFGESIVPYAYLLPPVLISTSMTAYLWFFGDLLIAVRDFRAYFLGNIAALLSTIPLSVFCVNLWDMNGVSFSGIAACAVGVLILGICLARDVRNRSLEQNS